MTSKRNSFDLSFKADVEETKISVGDFFMIIRRAGPSNKPYSSAFQKFQTENNRKLRHNIITDKQANNIIAGILVDHVITGWEDVKEREENGKWVEIKFSKKKCLEMLKIYPEVMNYILNEAQDVENFKRDEAEEISKK
jgi:hypothetical protein